MEGYPTTVSNAKNYQHTFWKNKPVANFDEIIHNSHIIDPDRKCKLEPLKLPTGLEWQQLQINCASQLDLESICDFLNVHIANPTKQKFRLDYNPNLIRLALSNNGTILKIVSSKTGTIFGLIGFAIDNLTVFSETERFGVCHFLCVNSSHRKKSIANILIDESIRLLLKDHLVLANYFMSDRCVPSPVCCVRQYRRPLNYERLHELKFCALQKDCTEKDIANFKVHGNVDKSIHPMRPSHIQQCAKLLRNFNVRFNVCKNYTESELMDALINNNSVSSYVILKDNKVIDFFSAYNVSYVQCNKEVNSLISSRNFYLYTCVNVTQDFIIQNVLRIAQNDNIDVFTCTDISLISNAILSKEFDVEDESDNDDKGKIYEYKFVKGGSKTYLNFVNWKCPKIRPIQLNAFWFNY